MLRFLYQRIAHNITGATWAGRKRRRRRLFAYVAHSGVNFEGKTVNLYFWRALKKVLKF